MPPAVVAVTTNPTAQTKLTTLALTISPMAAALSRRRGKSSAERSLPRYKPRYAGSRAKPHGLTAATIPAAKA